MAATVWFVVMAFIAVLLLFTVSIAATIGAADIFGSSVYNTQSSARSAHQSLTIAAALGWSVLVVLIIILIVAAVAGGFTTTEVSTALTSKDNLSKTELLALYQGEVELSGGQTTQIIVIVVLIIIAIVTFIIGILSVLAAVQLGGLSTQDSKSSNAYTAAIVASVAGVGGIAIMIIAIVTYFAVKSARDAKLKAIDEALKRGEKRLGITQEQLVGIGPETTVIKTAPETKLMKTVVITKEVQPTVQAIPMKTIVVTENPVPTTVPRVISK